MRLAKLAAFLICLSVFGARAASTEPEQCATVRMASPGWVDIDSTNALLGEILKGLGYAPKIRNLSVPLAYEGLRSGQLDVFLGNWMPAQTPLVAPLFKQGKIEHIATNLEGARFTLAVPAYAAAAGIQRFSDLQSHATEFSRKIYGIEAGAPANEAIKRMIATNAFGLGDWKLVESSDSGLLAQLGHDIANKKMVVFLAWEPHIMNTRFQIQYLDGGDQYFGANGGAATVSSVARNGLASQCPNLAKLLNQMKFTVAIENEMIRRTSELHENISAVAAGQLRDHPELLQQWLTGVTTRDGRTGLPAVNVYLSH